MNNVQERPPFSTGANVLDLRGQEPNVQWKQHALLPKLGGDRVNQLFRPASAIGEPVGGGIMNLPIIAQLLAIVQQLLSMLGIGWQPFAPGNYYQNATASSTGDPHLSFNGTDATGNAAQSRFDSMTAHPDLLDSDSFTGGYQISTTVTQPAVNGVTWNQQATIATNYGQTQVTLDKDGNASVTQNGQQYALANGQSYSLGNGETVTRTTDGSVVVTDTNGEGGNITTTLSENGSGVDVRTQALNVDLSGDLLAQQSIPAPLPIDDPPRERLERHR